MRRLFWLTAFIGCCWAILAGVQPHAQTVFPPGVTLSRGALDPAVGGGACAGGTVTFDASGFTANSGASPSTSTPITVGSGSNRALAVYVNQRTGTLVSVSSVTWNGTNMTLIGTDTSAAGTDTIYGLVNPAAGANNLVVTFVGGGTVSVAAMSVTGACQTGGATTFTNYTVNSSTSALATVTVPSANGQMGFAGFIGAINGFSTPSGCTDIGHDTSGSQTGASCRQASSGATVTMAYNYPNNSFWIASGISIFGN